MVRSGRLSAQKGLRELQNAEKAVFKLARRVAAQTEREFGSRVALGYGVSSLATR